MIEFNTPAKKDHPLLSLFDTELYLLFNKVKFAGVASLYPHTKYKSIIAYVPKRAGLWPKVEKLLYDTGWSDSMPQEGFPGDIWTYAKTHRTHLFIAKSLSAWQKLDNWASLMLLSVYKNEEECVLADNQLFKICVLGYTVNPGPDGKPQIKKLYMMDSPSSTFHDDEPEDSEEPDAAADLSQGSLDSMLSAMDQATIQSINNMLVTTPPPVTASVDENGIPQW